jgi:hypothetical protein
MNKFNEITKTVLGEATINPKIGSLFKKVSDLLSAKGLKAFEQQEILDVVQEAIKLGFNEGYKAGSTNPFK